MATPRVYADFQNLDDENRLRLTCAGTRSDLERQGIQLREGMVLTLYADDADDEGQPDELRAEGVVHYDPAEKCWVAVVDWQKLRHASDEPGFKGGVPSTRTTDSAAVTNSREVGETESLPSAGRLPWGGQTVP